jgi:predicted transcriptional regulator
MSYVQLLKYLDNLKEMGFAEEKTQPYRSFKITENGKLFMELVSRNGGSDSPSKQ